MKSIYYKTENKKIANVIKGFCEDEGFQGFDLLNEDINLRDVSFGLLISDEKFFEEFKDLKIPIAFIGQPKELGVSYFVMDENLDNIRLKVFVDAAINGGMVSNLNSSCLLKKISFKYEVSNDIFSIDKIVYNITKDFIYFFKLSDLQKIRIGISEMVTNAIEHGNLEISGDEKFEATENDSYYKLIETKRSDKKLGKRKATITVTLDEKHLKIVVKDRGKGFDTSKIKRNPSEEDLYKLHGRGILIASMYFDSIIYNKKGNVVTLLKKIQ
ncbi:MAG: ATP-binding protein [Calditerrivibrio sp.]|nr:ATP-binding protein [Calditerrivibrio sp.]